MKIVFNPVTKLFSVSNITLKDLSYDELMTHKKDWKQLQLNHTIDGRERGKDYSYIIAFNGKNPVGIAVLDNNGKELIQLVVDPTQRKMGIGTKLVQEVIDRGCNKLFVRKNNDKAINLYKKLGFEFTGYEMPAPSWMVEMKLSKNKQFSTSTKLYHVSEHPITSLEPRIPSNFLTDNGYEDNTTKRVCFSKSIDGCLMGMSCNLKDKIIKVYSITTDDYYTPTLDEVPDSKLTEEVWILKKVKPTYGFDIKVGEAKDKGYKYKYGNHTAELYKWNWRKLPKTKLFSASTQLSDIIEFNNYLNKFHYGFPFSPHGAPYYDLNPKGFNDSPVDEYELYYRTLTPSEFFKYKMGFCTDFTIAEADYFKKHFKDVKFETYNVEAVNDKYGASHDFLVFYLDDRVYWFESSLDKLGLSGVHEYNDLCTLMKDFCRIAKKGGKGNVHIIRKTNTENMINLKSKELESYIKNLPIIGKYKVIGKSSFIGYMNENI